MLNALACCRSRRPFASLAVAIMMLALSPHAFAQSAPSTSALPDQQAAPPADASPQAAHWSDDPFAQGNTFWLLRTGMSRDAHLGEIFHAQVAAGKFVQDDLALYFGVAAGYADAQEADDGILGGPHIGVRWHFLEKQKLSLYLDASSGIVFHQHPMTADSLHFNFDLQAGLGATWQLNEQLLLDTGIRWHHLSNARVKGKDRNLGYDGPMVYLGLAIPF